MTEANNSGVEDPQTPNHEEISEEAPPWVLVMLKLNFFGACNLHEHLKENKLDRFCIDCLASLCKTCTSNHDGHTCIKIRRYVYCEVINRTDFRKHFNCSDIQGYKTNRKKVIFLKQRGPQQEVKQQNLRDNSCRICNHSLQDSQYCSIQCKVSSMHETGKIEKTTQDHEANSNSEDGGDLVNGLSEGKGDLTPQSTRRWRRRKGLPVRSSLF